MLMLLVEFVDAMEGTELSEPLGARLAPEIVVFVSVSAFVFGFPWSSTSVGLRVGDTVLGP